MTIGSFRKKRILRMKINILKSLVLLTVVSLLLSCGEDEIAPIQINAEEFVMSIEENPEDGKALGTIIASTNRGDLFYEIMSQDPIDAIVLDPVTGDLTVGDVAAFDFEERQFTTAMIMVSNEDKEDVIIARINITDGIDNPRLESLVGHYPLDVEANDVSSYGNDGAVDGAIPSTDIQGIPGGALLFDGIDDQISISHAAQYDFSNEVTVSAVVNISEMKSGTIVSKGAIINGVGKTPYSISVAANGLIVFAVTVDNGSNTYDLRGITYELDEWIMITGILSGGKIYLYIDGEFAEEAEATGVLNTNSAPLLIGSRTQSTGNTINGAVDDVRLYDAALTAKEIKELYGNYSL
jgi:hypothetical protein